MDHGAAQAPGPVTPVDGTALLARTAALGEYFALPSRDNTTWHELPSLFDDDVLIDFIDLTRVAIATSMGCSVSDIPIKMAASSFQLGVAARLLSPVIGAASCFGTVPVLDIRSIMWQPTSTHSPRFAVTDVHWLPAPTPARATGVIAASLLKHVLGPLTDKLRALVSLSPQVAWGNITSAANGAVTVLAMAQPQHEGAGRELVRALLDIEPLAGTGEFVHGAFVRRSCCLFYQAPQAGLCGDCVLAVSGGSH